MTIPRIGVIGTGYWGRTTIRAFERARPGCVAATFDLRPERAAAEALTCRNATAYEDLEKLLSACDGVAVCVPPAQAAGLTLLALKAGTGVLVEKPPCLETSDFELLDHEARNVRRPLMVSHLYRHAAGFRFFRLHLRHWCGPLSHVRFERAGVGRLRPDTSVHWDLAFHDLRMLDDIMRDAPTRVSAAGGRMSGDSGPMATVFWTADFRTGVFAGGCASWLSPITQRCVTVIGRDGLATYEDLRNGRERVRRYPGERDVRVIGGVSDPTSIRRYEREFSSQPLQRADESPVDPLGRQCAAFLRRLQGSTWGCQDRDAVSRVVRTLERIDESLGLASVPAASPTAGASPSAAGKV